MSWKRHANAPERKRKNKKKKFAKKLKCRNRKGDYYSPWEMFKKK